MLGTGGEGRHIYFKSFLLVTKPCIANSGRVNDGPGTDDVHFPTAVWSVIHPKRCQSGARLAGIIGLWGIQVVEEVLFPEQIPD